MASNPTLSADNFIQATGGISPFAWIISTGTLLHNLSLSTSTTDIVTISGTPDTVAQAVTFTIQITDSAHYTATQAYAVSILLQSDSLVLSSASLNFGNEVVGGAMTEMLTNTATSDKVSRGPRTAGARCVAWREFRGSPVFHLIRCKNHQELALAASIPAAPLELGGSLM